MTETAYLRVSELVISIARSPQDNVGFYEAHDRDGDRVTWAHHRARGARKNIAALTFEEQPEPAVLRLGIGGGD